MILFSKVLLPMIKFTQTYQKATAQNYSKKLINVLNVLILAWCFIEGNALVFIIIVAITKWSLWFLVYLHPVIKFYLLKGNSWITSIDKVLAKVSYNFFWKHIQTSVKGNVQSIVPFLLFCCYYIKHWQIFFEKI